MSAPTELVYFTVIGHWYDVEAPDIKGDSNTPQFEIVNAFIDFMPRVPQGFSALVPNLDLGDGTSESTAVALAPITARIIDGALCTIDPNDTPGMQLLANSAPIQAALDAAQWPPEIEDQPFGTLVYDVRFRDVRYAASARVLSNFAFIAPQDDSVVDLTDPSTTRVQYIGPT
jgi:hypothetical protein